MAGDSGNQGGLQKAGTQENTALTPSLPANPSPSHGLVLVFLLQRSASIVSRGPAQTRLFLIERNERHRRDWGSRGSFKGLKLLLPRASEDVDLPVFLLHLRGWTDTRPRACLGPPQGTPPRPLLTWSCLRACAAPASCIPQTQIPWTAALLERETGVGSRTRAPRGVGRKQRSWEDQVHGFPGAPWTSPQLSDFFSPSWFPERPQPRCAALLLVVWKNQPTRFGQSRHLRPGGLLINR